MSQSRNRLLSKSPPTPSCCKYKWEEPGFSHADIHTAFIQKKLEESHYIVPNAEMWDFYHLMTLKMTNCLEIQYSECVCVCVQVSAWVRVWASVYECIYIYACIIMCRCLHACVIGMYTVILLHTFPILNTNPTTQHYQHCLYAVLGLGFGDHTPLYSHTQ